MKLNIKKATVTPKAAQEYVSAQRQSDAAAGTLIKFARSAVDHVTGKAKNIKREDGADVKWMARRYIGELANKAGATDLIKSAPKAKCEHYGLKGDVWLVDAKASISRTIATVIAERYAKEDPKDPGTQPEIPDELAAMLSAIAAVVGNMPKSSQTKAVNKLMPELVGLMDSVLPKKHADALSELTAADADEAVAH